MPSFPQSIRRHSGIRRTQDRVIGFGRVLSEAEAIPRLLSIQWLAYDLCYSQIQMRDQSMMLIPVNSRPKTNSSGGDNCFGFRVRSMVNLVGSRAANLCTAWSACMEYWRLKQVNEELERLGVFREVIGRNALSKSRDMLAGELRRWRRGMAAEDMRPRSIYLLTPVPSWSLLQKYGRSQWELSNMHVGRDFRPIIGLHCDTQPLHYYC